MKVLTQIWRVIRLFALAFVAQLTPLLATSTASSKHITWALLASAGVAAVESLYRQYFPSGKPNGLVANLFSAYQLVKDAAAEAASAAVPVATVHTNAVVPAVTAATGGPVRTTDLSVVPPAPPTTFGGVNVVPQAVAAFAPGDPA